MEVVVALLILEVGLLGTAGILAAATSTMNRAETLERIVAEAQGLLDSLAIQHQVSAGARSFRGGELSWTVDREGLIHLVGMGPNADTLLVLLSGTVGP